MRVDAAPAAGQHQGPLVGYRHNKFLYLVLGAIGLLLLPFWLGFPQSDGLRYYLEDHGRIVEISSVRYALALASYGIGIVGLVALVLGLVKLQEQYGLKPRIILVLIEPRFFPEVFSHIKGDAFAKILLIIDVAGLVFLLFFAR